VQRSAHSGHALFHDGGIAGRERILPVVHIHHRVDANARSLGGFLHFLGFARVAGGRRLDDLESGVPDDLEAIRVSEIARNHVQNESLFQGQVCRFRIRFFGSRKFRDKRLDTGTRETKRTGGGQRGLHEVAAG
jgi:hypothetical protein